MMPSRSLGPMIWYRSQVTVLASHTRRVFQLSTQDAETAAEPHPISSPPQAVLSSSNDL